MSSSQNAKGFTVIEVVVVIVAVACIGFAVFFATRQNKVSAPKAAIPTQSAAASASPSPVATLSALGGSGSYSTAGYVITPLKFTTTISRTTDKYPCEAGSSKICSTKGVSLKWNKDVPGMVAVTYVSSAKTYGLYGTGVSASKGVETIIQPFVDPAQLTNGTYSGSTVLKLQQPNGSFADGPTIEFSITLTD